MNKIQATFQIINSIYTNRTTVFIITQIVFIPILLIWIMRKYFISARTAYRMIFVTSCKHQTVSYSFIYFISELLKIIFIHIYINIIYHLNIVYAVCRNFILFENFLNSVIILLTVNFNINFSCFFIVSHL